MSTNYELWLKTPTGTPLAILDRFISLDYQRTVNAIGTLAIDLPYGAYPDSYFDVDAIIEVWRSIDGAIPYLEGGTIFFCQGFFKRVSANGEKILHVEAQDALSLLNRRFIQYGSNTTYTDKTGTADNIIKAFVRENMGSLATDSARDLSKYLTIAPDVSAAPSASKAAAHRNLLKTIQEICDDSYTKGTYLAFDIVSNTPTSGVSLTFRTYTNYRGVDHRLLKGLKTVMLDPGNGNLTELERAIDYRPVLNAVCAGGQGVGDLRFVQIVIDYNSLGLSPFNRREDFIDARNSGDSGTVGDEANAQLFNRRLRKIFTARYVDTPAIKYGRDFGFGDYLTTNWDRDAADMRVNSVGIKVQNHTETLNVILRSDT